MRFSWDGPFECLSDWCGGERALVQPRHWGNPTQTLDCFKGTAARDFREMGCLNVCLTGVEGRELWFNRGIEEILHIYEIFLKGQQHEIFPGWVVWMSVLLVLKGGSPGSTEASRRPYIDRRLFERDSCIDFCWMVRLNVCLTGVEGRELWFSRGIEEILHKHETVLKGQQEEIFVRWSVCMSV